MVLDRGMNHLIIVAYRQLISSVFLTPLAYLWERESWSKLTPCLMGQMFLCALLGLTLCQYFFLLGLKYTSTTFMCAFINMVPVITFIIALPFGMEKANMKSKSGKAKVLGTLTCVGGALILMLYKGLPLITRKPRPWPSTKAAGWGVIGSIYLCAGSLSWSSWFLIQTRVGNKYPFQYSSTAIMSMFSAVQSTILCFIVDRNISKWALKGKLEILCILYAGIIASGLCYVVMSWCVKQRGPVFTSAFSPLIQIFAAAFDVSILHQQIYLGR
ncbi:WAT1-related protein [Forsythia ovata]|uniref:WAT1-related protein n=1 Tax=Forsythia ovata TaxID=205694 RepID=A0ABD1QQZ5_9LAMI